MSTEIDLDNAMHMELWILVPREKSEAVFEWVMDECATKLDELGAEPQTATSVPYRKFEQRRELLLTDAEWDGLKEWLQDQVDDDYVDQMTVDILEKLGGDTSKAQVDDA